MSEENKALVRRLNKDLWQDLDVSKVDEYYAADYVSHSQLPGTPPGREGVKAFINMMKSSFSDLNYVTEDLVAEGDKVVSRYTVTSTHTGEFMGIPATGKQVKVTGIFIARVTDGKVVESWTEWDSMGTMQQLGVVPPPGE